MATEEVELVCVNHPRTATLIRCCNCDKPICVKCMQETPVGMKCPECATLKLRHEGGPRRYAAGAAGLLTAAVIGYGLLSTMGRINFLLALALGGATGIVVQKVSRRKRGIGGAAALASVFGLAMGALALGAAPTYLATPAFWVPGLVAAAAAAFISSR
jgi:hypothetical protein